MSLLSWLLGVIGVMNEGMWMDGWMIYRGGRAPTRSSDGADVFFAAASGAGCGYRELVDLEVGVRMLNSDAEFCGS